MFPFLWKNILEFILFDSWDDFLLEESDSPDVVEISPAKAPFVPNIYGFGIDCHLIMYNH